ncbi:MAG: SDR family oxidoreductase [Alphaproteobacteria bacterium]|nr:SDR family oxidoreductase [Alphaproteobacteria bacterium]
MDLNLKGKSVLITGASKGIGLAAAEAFAEEGCDLHLAARSEDLLAAHARRLEDAHRIRVSVHPADLRRSADVDRLADACGDIDVLVNNAGDIPQGTLGDIDEERWRHAWDLKVFGFINLTRRIYAGMKARGGGVIINDIGAAGERFDFNYLAGSTGNAALMAFTRALGGRSLMNDNIRVVGINPGPVETDRMVNRLQENARAKWGDETRWRELTAAFPLGRAAKPREIADLMAFLASDRSGYTTGVICTVDGGWSARN